MVANYLQFLVFAIVLRVCSQTATVSQCRDSEAIVIDLCIFRGGFDSCGIRDLQESRIGQQCTFISKCCDTSDVFVSVPVMMQGSTRCCCGYRKEKTNHAVDRNCTF